MSVLWHSSLTLAQEKKIENIQVTSLRVILQESFVSYPASLEMTGLQKLSDRRRDRCLVWAKRCLKNPTMKDMFPLNPSIDYDVRARERYTVNFANTECYRDSTIPYCQRLLNEDARARSEKDKSRGPGQ